VKQVSKTARVTMAIFLLGVLLHLHTVLFKTDGGTPDLAGILFLLALFLWSCLPYAIWTVVARWRGQSAPAVGASLGTLAFDCYVYYGVFIAPTGSTASLALLFAPLWNIVVFGPLGAAISWPLLHFAIRGQRNVP
jgi:hypothetical protein